MYENLLIGINEFRWWIPCIMIEYPLNYIPAPLTVLSVGTFIAQKTLPILRFMKISISLYRLPWQYLPNFQTLYTSSSVKNPYPYLILRYGLSCQRNGPKTSSITWTRFWTQSTELSLLRLRLRVKWTRPCSKICISENAGPKLLYTFICWRQNISALLIRNRVEIIRSPLE